jgi:hypothetical protein
MTRTRAEGRTVGIAVRRVDLPRENDRDGKLS